jgi:putative MATE family efflux protein
MENILEKKVNIKELEINPKEANTDMTTGSVISHIKRIAIPSSIGFLFNTLFNVVDTFFAGKLGPDALAGLSMSFPIFFIILALSSGIGTGATALLSIALGKKNTDDFHRLGLNAIVMGAIMSVILIFSASSISPLLFGFMGANGLALSYGIAYTNVLFYGCFFFIMNFIINGLLNAQGDTRTFRNFLLIGFLLNIILDPLFIMGWFGLPKMGVAGIALATVIVQVIGTFYLSYKLRKSPIFNFNLLKKAKISFVTSGSILKQGIPASLNMMTIAIGVFVINHFVVKFGGQTAVGAYGVALRIEQLILLPAIGLNIAVLTITGQNFGARNFSRIYEVYKLSIIIALVIMTFGMFVIYPFAKVFVGWFNSDISIVSVGVQYLRIEVFGFFTYVILSISSSILQGVKKPVFAVYIGLYRQIILPVAIFYYLGDVLQWGLLGVWWGIVIINWSAVVISVIYTLIILKKVSKVDLLNEY